VEENIKVDRKEVGWVSVEWVNPTRDRYEWDGPFWTRS